MRNLLSILFLLITSTAWAQGPLDTTFVVVARFQGFSTVNDSTFSGSAIVPSDQLGQNFNPTQVNVNDYILDQLGRVFRISSISAATAGNITFQCVEKQDNDIAPVGIGQIVRDDGTGIFPISPNNTAAISSQLQARLLNNNVVNLKQRLADSIAVVRAEITDDQTAAEVPFTPESTIVATDVQAAIVEALSDANAYADTSAALRLFISSIAPSQTVTTTTIYCPAHGLDTAAYTGSVIALKAGCVLASATSSANLQTRYVVGIPHSDSLEIQIGGLIYRPGNGLNPGQQYYLKNSPAGQSDTIPGTVNSKTFVVVDANYIYLVDPSSTGMNSYVPVINIPAPALAVYGTDTKAPNDTAVQNIAEVYAAAGAIVPGSYLITTNATISDNPVYRSNSDGSSTPSHAWHWNGQKVTRVYILPVSIDLQDTLYGGSGILPLDTIVPAGSVPTTTEVVDWLQTNYTDNGLRLPNGSQVYWVGNGSQSEPEYIWQVQDDLSHELTNWERIVKLVKSPSTWLKPELENGADVEVISDNGLSILGTGETMSLYINVEGIEGSDADFETYVDQYGLSPGRLSLENRSFTRSTSAFPIIEFSSISDDSDDFPRMSFNFARYTEDIFSSDYAQLGDVLGRIAFGTGLFIQGVAADDFGVGYNPTSMQFWLSDDGAEPFKMLELNPYEDYFSFFDKTGINSAYWSPSSSFFSNNDPENFSISSVEIANYNNSKIELTDWNENSIGSRIILNSTGSDEGNTSQIQLNAIYASTFGGTTTPGRPEGDRIGSIDFGQSSRIKAISDEDQDGLNQGGSLVFQTSEIGSNEPIDRLVINSMGTISAPSVSDPVSNPPMLHIGEDGFGYELIYDAGYALLYVDPYSIAFRCRDDATGRDGQISFEDPDGFTFSGANTFMDDWRYSFPQVSPTQTSGAMSSLEWAGSGSATTPAFVRQARGSATIVGDGDGEQTVSVTFAAAMPDTVYNIQLTLRGTTGTLDVGEKIFQAISPTTSGFVISLHDPLETGESVTIDWSVVDQ